MAEDGLFQVEITCPDHVFFKGQATMIEFDTLEGRVGIYKNHIPETYILQPGTVVITTPDKKLQASLKAGFAEVLFKKVTILAEDAGWLGELSK